MDVQRHTDSQCTLLPYWKVHLMYSAYCDFVNFSNMLLTKWLVTTPEKFTKNRNKNDISTTHCRIIPIRTINNNSTTNQFKFLIIRKSSPMLTNVFNSAESLTLVGINVYKKRIYTPIHSTSPYLSFMIGMWICHIYYNTLILKV